MSSEIKNFSLTQYFSYTQQKSSLLAKFHLAQIFQLKRQIKASFICRMKIFRFAQYFSYTRQKNSLPAKFHLAQIFQLKRQIKASFICRFN